MQYKGVIEKVFFSGNKWSSILVKDRKSEKRYKAAGNICYPVAGNNIDIEGYIKVDPTYGEQICVESCVMKQSKTAFGIKTFLSGEMIKGIGPKTAELIYAKFGQKSLKVIENSPEELLSIKGISPDRLKMIVSSYKESQKYEKICTLANGMITPLQARRIYGKYGERSVQVLKKNPYRLMYDVDGIGFLKADAIAKSIGVKVNAPERIRAALVYTLTKLSESGHCFVCTEVMERTCLDYLCPFPEFPVKKQNHLYQDTKDALDKWIEEKEQIYSQYGITGQDKKKLNSWVNTACEFLDLMAEELEKEIMRDLEPDPIKRKKNPPQIHVENEERIYLQSLWIAENKCAEIIGSMVKSKSVKTISLEEIQAKIVDSERDGLKLGAEQIQAIKTSLSHRISIITGGPGRGKTTIIKSIMDIWGNKDDVILCAPTGRAAQRMKETTGHEASTIHKQLMISEKTHKTKQNYLVIIDESSMLDISLACRVLEWAKDNNIIFVGDVDQLPSVGPGNFFRDMINSNLIPTTVLKTGYRNEGTIEKNAHRINNGKSMKYMEFDEDFQFIEVEKEKVQETILSIYQDLCKSYTFKDICVLSPMRQRSQSGTNLLNPLIRDHMNPGGKTEFREKDRIMCLCNNTKKEVIKDGVEEYGIYNGDCGELVQLDAENNLFHIQLDDGRTGIFDAQEMREFTLAYAITIHKSQGSEYPVVIIPMNKEHYIMLQRNLLYTAVTRAKKKVILVGDKRAFDMAIQNTDYKERNSMLRQRIVEKILK